MATRDSSFAYSIDQAQRLFGKGLEVIGSRTGIESLFNYGQEIVAQQDKDIREGNYQPEYTMGLREAYRQGGLSDAIGWVAEKTGENIATSGIALGGGLASALTAPFSVPAAALIGGATILGSGIVGTGEVAEEMEQKTGSYNDSVAIGAGTIIALLDRFGAGRVIPRDELLTITGKELIKKLGEAGKIDAAKEIGRRIGKSVAFEGGTEGLQEGVVVGSTALTGGEYTGEQIADRLLEGVVLGGTMGGGMTTTIEAFRQGPGIAGLIGDTMGPGGMLPPSQQLAMQTAASLYGPSFAKYRAKDVPPGTAETLMNEAVGQTGTELTTQQKVDGNLSITKDTDPNIDEEQTFFSKDLEGGSVGNPSVQKIAEEELKAIEQKAQEIVKQDQDAGFTTDPQFVKNFINQEFNKAKNKERFTDPEDPVVSPLRIKLIKLAADDKFGMKNPVKVSEVYDELRKQERRREGSVGLLGKEQYTESIQDQVKYIPIQGKGKEFGQAVKAAGKTEDGRIDYESIPNIKDIAVKTTIPKKIKSMGTVFDAPNERGDLIIHNRGGEAFISGLEEYLIRNQNETKTMEEIIYEFDQMRPTVRLEVRSGMNRRTNGPFRNFALSAGEILADPSLAPPGTIDSEEGYSGQRIFSSFATVTGKPINVEQPTGQTDARGNQKIKIVQNRDPDAQRLGSGKAFEIDNISVVAVNPDQESLKAGSLTNSPVINALQQKTKLNDKTIEENLVGEKELNLPHDYYNKGFGYTRAMIVRGADGKLYAIVEEIQSDVTRTYENLLDFAKPEYAYGTPVEYGGIPELFSGAIDTALRGNDPYLTRTFSGGARPTDKRPIRTLNTTMGDFTGRDSPSSYRLFTPSEKNKIRVLDAMDQEMSDDDAPSQFNQDLTRKRKLFQEAEKKVNLAKEEIEKINNQIERFQTTRTAPMEISKIQNVTLDDLKTLRKTLPKNVMSYVKAYAKQKEEGSVSGRQVDTERLNKAESMLESILFTDTDYSTMAENFIEGLEAMDGFEGTQFANDPRQEAMREFDGFQMAQNGEFAKPAPDRLAAIILKELGRTKLRTPVSDRTKKVAAATPKYNLQGKLRLNDYNLTGDQNEAYISQLGFPIEYNEKRGQSTLVKTLVGHMPLRSNYQGMPGDSYSDLGKQTSDVGETRDFRRAGLMYAHGKEEREIKDSYISSPEGFFEALLDQNLQEKGYNYSETTSLLADSTSAFRQEADSDFGFRGSISEEDLTDAIIKTMQSTLERGVNEAVNEQALNVIRHEIGSYMANKFKTELSSIDFDAIQDRHADESALREGARDRAIGRFPAYFNHKYDKILSDIENLIPPKVKKDIEKELSRIIDNVSDSIGFVPEDGNYKEYMEEIDTQKQRTIGAQTVNKYSKQLGLDNKDALKKKLLIGSMLRNEKVYAYSGVQGGMREKKEKRLEQDDSLLNRFIRTLPTGVEADRLRQIQLRLAPVPYEENDYNPGSSFSGYRPSLTSVYKLFLTPSYKGFLEGDKVRAEKILKQKTNLEKQLPALEKQMKDNEVGADNNKEIDRRFKKLYDQIGKKAKEYNYAPSELREAAMRLYAHINDNKKYTRSPNNATMAQTSRGLLQSLIHKLTDPRFEELYKEPIAGIVVPHREDQWTSRAKEDTTVQGLKKTFGLGTYGSTLDTVAKRFEDAGATVDRDRIFEMVSADNTRRAQLNRPVQFVIDLSPGSKGRKLAEGKFTFRAKGGYIDLRRKAS
jgi:hypothetical protein